MRLLLAFIILLLGNALAYSQNLLPNGSFEDENICTEYQQNCAPEAWIATSLYANYYFDASQPGAAQAYDGTHFIGLTAGSIRAPGMRNFIRTRLLCGLRKGHLYRLEFYVSSYHPVLDSIGIYFSTTDFLYEKRNFKEINPQLWSVNGFEKKEQDPAVWQKVSLLYTASGTEGYMTIGNFKRVDYKGIQRGEYRYDYYFFVDAVSLTPVDVNEKLCAEADSMKKEIYAVNERHHYLEKRVYSLRRNPPAEKPLPPTREQVPQHIDTLIIPDIFFATASYELRPKSHPVLDSFATQLKKLAIDSLVIEGHTDSIGKIDYNQALSFNRAVSVKNYLLQKVPELAAKTTTRGFAFLRPVATNKTPAGRQQNRRVAIFVYRRLATTGFFD